MGYVILMLFYKSYTKKIQQRFLTIITTIV